MDDRELDALLREALDGEDDIPRYLNTRLRGELALARKGPRGFSVWWLPLALSMAVGAAMVLLGGLLPWPVSLLLALSALFTVGAAAVFTLVGLLCFDLRRKGRVFLS